MNADKRRWKKIPVFIGIYLRSSAVKNLVALSDKDKAVRRAAELRTPQAIDAQFCSPDGAKAGEAGISRMQLTCIRAAERAQQILLRPG